VVASEGKNIRKPRKRMSRANWRQRDSTPNRHLMVPYIKRHIPPYDLLDEESLHKIEPAADAILAEIGIEFRDDPKTVRLFRQAGAQVTVVNNTACNIRFEPGMIGEILKTAPQRFTQHES